MNKWTHNPTSSSPSLTFRISFPCRTIIVSIPFSPPRKSHDLLQPFCLNTQLPFFSTNFDYRDRREECQSRQQILKFCAEKCVKETTNIISLGATVAVFPCKKLLGFSSLIVGTEVGKGFRGGTWEWKLSGRIFQDQQLWRWNPSMIVTSLIRFFSVQRSSHSQFSLIGSLFSFYLIRVINFFQIRAVLVENAVF